VGGTAGTLHLLLFVCGFVACTASRFPRPIVFGPLPATLPRAVWTRLGMMEGRGPVPRDCGRTRRLPLEREEIACYTAQVNKKVASVMTRVEVICARLQWVSMLSLHTNRSLGNFPSQMPRSFKEIYTKY
jgi:hypothetical protein